MATVTLQEPAGVPMPHWWEPLKLYRRRVASKFMQRRVRRRDFSIISNDCWGGMACEELGMRYESPFVGLFILPGDYIRLLRQLRRAIEGGLDFRDYSHDNRINAWRDEIRKAYPIGVIGDDVEVHFLHYRSREEAAVKWQRRAARIHWSALRVKMSWHEHPDIEHLLREFDAMPLPAKILLAPKRLEGTRHCVAFKDFSTDGTQQYWRGHKAFDVAAFLEKGEIRRATWTRPIDWLLYSHY